MIFLYRSKGLKSNSPQIMPKADTQKRIEETLR